MAKNIKRYMFYLGLECANKYKLAIPSIVVKYTIKQFPLLEKKEILGYCQEICRKINKMKDVQINKEIEKLKGRKWMKK
ncbi:MAG: hypothetical protein N3D10_02410 [Candidatus Micrarchaeota archaeon]|nr:hypothetical protein [Candidatus Micrarchaeota archaeon]